MNFTEYTRRVIQLYLDAPETPARPRRSDWAIARDFYQRRIELRTVAHAIHLASLRRQLRDPSYPPLEPIRSLAYFRPLLDELAHNPHDPGYVRYIAERYRLLASSKGARLSSVSA